MTDFNQRSQKVDTQYNAGKDQFIQNIVLVGQLLDFAKVEGLIPKQSSPINFQNVVTAFETTFDKRLGNDLAQATSTAGEILRKSIVKWTPKDAFSALPLKEILTEIPIDLYKSLTEKHLWNAFFEKQGYDEVIRLYSLEILWKKYFGKSAIFSIAKNQYYSDPANTDNTFILYNEAEYLDYLFAFLRNLGDQKLSFDLGKNRLNVSSITYAQFRIIIAGIVIDLIRLSSIASTDVKFWKDIAGLLQIQKAG